MDSKELRREALRRFVATQGGHAAVVARFRLTPSQASYLSQLITPGSIASFGELSAKNWEQRFGLRNQELQRPTATELPATAAKVTQTPTVTESASANYFTPDDHPSDGARRPQGEKSPDLKSILAAMPFTAEDLEALLVRVGKHLASLDLRSRKAIAGFMYDMAMEPDDSADIAHRIAINAKHQGPVTDNAELDRSIKGRRGTFQPDTVHGPLEPPRRR